METLLRLGGLIMIIALIVSPLALLAELLNARDRREAKLATIVWSHFASREVRGLIGLKIRCATLGKRSCVTLYPWSCFDDGVWQAITRLAHQLPPHVHLRVECARTGGLAAIFLGLRPGGNRLLARGVHEHCSVQPRHLEDPKHVSA